MKRHADLLCESKEQPSDEQPSKIARYDVNPDEEIEDEYESQSEDDMQQQQQGDDEDDTEDVSMENQDKTKQIAAQHRTTRILQYGGHPRGIRPWGNFYFDYPTEQQQQTFKHPKLTGLGALASLSDDRLLDFIKWMDLHTLCRLSCVSRATYILCFEEEIWRHMCLALWKGDFRYHSTWRQTVAYEHVTRKRMEQQQQQQQHDMIDDDNKILPKSTAPIRVNSYYSDILFQPWYCLSMDLSRFTWIDNIDRRSNLTVDEFITQYERPLRPVILTDIVPSWPAYTEWTRSKLLSQYGDVIYKVGAYRMTMKNYLSYSEQAKEETPLYMFDNAYPQNTPEFAKQYTVPPHFSTDYFNYIEDPSLRPSYRWILIGPPRSGSTFHKDPNGTSAWNGLISGAKKWILFPPDYIPPGVFPSQDDAEVITPISVMEWFIHYYHQCHEKQNHNIPSPPPSQHLPKHMMKQSQISQQRHVEPIECVCKPGELIFIPAGWYHTAMNIEESIAVTQNYVSEQNFAYVLSFLTKEGISKKPLLDALKDGLMKYEPQVLERVQQQLQLQQQQEQPKSTSLWAKLMSSQETTSTSTTGFSLSSMFNQTQEEEPSESIET